MKIKVALLLIWLCLVLVTAGYALAGNFKASLVSVPSIDRTLYPSPDVPESAAVDDAYFDDAVFVGDSILSGLQVYGLMSNAEFACEIGTSASRALKSRVIKKNYQLYTLIDLALLNQPNKIYIMLGTNGIDIVKTDQVLGDMRNLIAYTVENRPEAIIYIISLPPVTPTATEKHRLLNNENIVIYNEGLRQIALDYQVYYLHTNPLFVQEDGSLNRSFAAKDGYHMLQQAHMIFRDYLYTHTIPLDP